MTHLQAPTTPAPQTNAQDKQRNTWPFPPNGQPTPWTAAQIAAHAAQQREELGEALL